MKIVGLIAGTSLDGIDAALVDWNYSRGKASVELLGFKFVKYSPETVRLIREVSDTSSGTVDKVALLNFYLGELFADAALKVIRYEPGERIYLPSVIKPRQVFGYRSVIFVK